MIRMLSSSSDLVPAARSDCLGCKSRHSAPLDAVARDEPLTYCAQYTFGVRSSSSSSSAFSSSDSELSAGL